MQHTALNSQSRSFRRAAGALRLVALAPLVLLAGCDLYDFGDLIGGGSGGSGSGGTGAAGTGGAVAICEVDGVQHSAGESFPSPDGCNECFCDESGGVACTERGCEPLSCGGLAGASCPDGQFCSFPPEAQCGAADQTGQCAVQPDFCTLQFDPVCGCDDRTYGNACAAASAGVSVAFDGECQPQAECSSDADCPIPPCACLDENADGVCENECPVPLCARGQCTVVSGTQLQLGDVCGGFRPAGSPDCGSGLFCQHQPGALCGAADAPGECVAIPDVCADVFDPVCGCDGVTYPNACEASANQAGILDLGACQ